jgi:hypothetical protein
MDNANGRHGIWRAWEGRARDSESSWNAEPTNEHGGSYRTWWTILYEDWPSFKMEEWFRQSGDGRHYRVRRGDRVHAGRADRVSCTRKIRSLWTRHQQRLSGALCPNAEIRGIRDGSIRWLKIKRSGSATTTARVQTSIHRHHGTPGDRRGDAAKPGSSHTHHSGHK